MNDRNWTTIRIRTNICDATGNSLNRELRIVQFRPFLEEIFAQLSVYSKILTKYQGKEGDKTKQTKQKIT